MGPMTIAAGQLATAKQPTGGSPLFLILLVVGFVLIYMLVMRPQRLRQQRKIQEQQSQVLPGRRIRTASGMYGTVVSGDDRDVVIEVAPGVNVTMLRRAIMEVIPEDDPADLAQDGEMPHHEDLAPDDAEVSEQDSDGMPADDRDLKDRNV